MLSSELLVLNMRWLSSSSQPNPGIMPANSPVRPRLTIAHVRHMLVPVYDHVTPAPSQYSQEYGGRN